MNTERVYEGENGYWLASGNGPLRTILVEAETRREALRAFMDRWHRQDSERTTREIKRAVLRQQAIARKKTPKGLTLF